MRIVRPRRIWPFQYLGSRGAQPPSILRALTCSIVSILGLARSPTFIPVIEFQTSSGFNTWAREEPNKVHLRVSLVIRASILGLARSPTSRSFALPNLFMCFNTWAREEPNVSGIDARVSALVSILGLARSPTRRRYGCTAADFRFNTWAREEPNLTFTHPGHWTIVSILGLARSPTWLNLPLIFLTLFQYLGSRGAQPGLIGGLADKFAFQYLGSRGAQRRKVF